MPSIQGAFDGGEQGAADVNKWQAEKKNPGLPTLTAMRIPQTREVCVMQNNSYSCDSCIWMVIHFVSTYIISWILQTP